MMNLTMTTLRAPWRWLLCMLPLSALLHGCDQKGTTRTNAMAATASSAPVANVPSPAPDFHPAAPGLNLRMVCEESATVGSGSYLVENNVWGKANLTDWSQCIGATNSAQRGLAARWTWDWKYQGDNVKAYPEVIFGHKPGYLSSTTTQLPRRLGEVRHIDMSYDISTQRSGTGNLSLDMWLTDSPSPTTFAVPPITHEVMIWLEIFGPMYAGGDQIDTVSINGIPYRVYVGEKFGLGWRYIAFKPENTPMRPVARMDLMPYLLYLQSKRLVSASSYLSAINFGNEIISGSGSTQLNHFAIDVQ